MGHVNACSGGLLFGPVKEITQVRFLKNDDMRPQKLLPVGVATVGCFWFTHGPCLLSRKFYKIFHILRHIESLDACMKY